MKFELIKATDEYVCKPKISLPRAKTLYPSEASVKWTDQHGEIRTSGACLRQSWYRLASDETPAAFDAYSMWIFALGKAVENELIETWKRMGIWVDNNIKFYDQERNISGEIDGLIVDPNGQLICLECKSFAGYPATKGIMGNKSTKGYPKTSQMLQTLIYVDLGKKLNLWSYAKMVYYARDSGLRREFDIDLINDGELKRPTINGEIDYRFVMDDIYDRYAELSSYIDKKILPPRDYDYRWDPDKVHRRQALGEVSDSAFKNWQRSPTKYPQGDWQCRYCKYSKICQSQD